MLTAALIDALEREFNLDAHRLCLRTHTARELATALAHGEKVFSLDTGPAAEDDYLIAADEDEATDILLEQYERPNGTSLPYGWKLVPLTYEVNDDEQVWLVS